MENTTNQNEIVALPRKKRGRLVITLLLLVALGIQFIQPDKNNNDVLAKNDISALVPLPDSVQLLLKNACFDCHSNNTQYPWYTDIQPVGWWLSHHVDEGKEHLNFNEFASLPSRNGRSSRERQLKKLDEIRETIEEGEMPLSSYTLIHKEARLTDAQKKMIIEWADSSRHFLLRKK